MSSRSPERIRVAYVCEGAGDRGWGHLGRGYALWETAPDEITLVVGRGYGEFQAWAYRRGGAAAIEPWESREAPLNAEAAPYDAVLVDDYILGDAWIEGMAAGRPTFVVDDWMRPSVRATGVVNPNLGANRGDYRESEAQTWLLGPRYAPVRRELRDVGPRPVSDGGIRRITVTLGGSDPGGHTATVAEGLTGLPWYRAGGGISVILGSSYSGPAPWTAWPARRVQRLEVVQDPIDYVARCSGADLVVCGAGTTSYEMAVLGRPFLPITLVENQRRVGAAWAERGVGSGVCVWRSGWLEQVMEDVEALLASHARHKALAAAVSGIVDGRGAERILSEVRGAVTAARGAIRGSERA